MLGVIHRCVACQAYILLSFSLIDIVSTEIAHKYNDHVDVYVDVDLDVDADIEVHVAVTLSLALIMITIGTALLTQSGSLIVTVITIVTW